MSTNTKNLTPILENKFYFDNINTIKLVLEHQQTENLTTYEKYYTDVIAIEYLRSPNFNVSLVTEIKTTEPEESKNNQEGLGLYPVRLQNRKSYRLEFAHWFASGR